MLAELVDVPVLQDVEQKIDMRMPVNGRWVSGTGGDVEYNKKSTTSVPSQSMEREEHQNNSAGELLAIHETIERLMQDLASYSAVARSSVDAPPLANHLHSGDPCSPVWTAERPHTDSASPQGLSSSSDIRSEIDYNLKSCQALIFAPM